MITVSFLPIYIALSMIWIIVSIPRIKSKRTTVSQELCLWVLYIYLLGVIHFTFTPFQIAPIYFSRDATFIPFVETLAMIQNARLSVSLYNILGNIALLVPFGFLLPAIYPRVRKLATVFAYSLILSLFIETLQWVYAVRIFDIDDVILNTIGGCLGFIVFSLIGKAVSRNKPDLKGNDWAEKSPIRLFVSGLCFFTLITSVAYAASYYTQTLSTSDIQRQDEKAGNKQMLTSAASDYLYILNKDESGELRLDLYIVFPLSRHIEAAWDTTPAHDESDTSILGDIFFKVSYPNLNGTEREMITKRIPYAIYGETSKGIKEVYAEYGDEKYSALINEGSFLIIIDREIPLEDLRDKIYVKTVDESGEIKTLGFDD